MAIGHGRNQRLVRHTQHLMLLTQIMEFLGDRLGNPPRYPHIDLIKDHRPYGINLGETSLQRQQKAAHFPTRGDFPQGL